MIMEGKERRLLCLLGLYETTWIFERNTWTRDYRFSDACNFYNELVSGYNILI